MKIRIIKNFGFAETRSEYTEEIPQEVIDEGQKQ